MTASEFFVWQSIFQTLMLYNEQCIWLWKSYFPLLAKSIWMMTWYVKIISRAQARILFMVFVLLLDIFCSMSSGQLSRYWQARSRLVVWSSLLVSARDQDQWVSATYPDTWINATDMRPVQTETSSRKTVNGCDYSSSRFIVTHCEQLELNFLYNYRRPPGRYDETG